jgi:hypothetical protein
MRARRRGDLTLAPIEIGCCRFTTAAVRLHRPVREVAAARGGHAARVVAWLVRATPSVEVQTKTIGVAGTRPATPGKDDRCFNVTGNRSTLPVTVTPGAAIQLREKHGGPDRT